MTINSVRLNASLSVAAGTIGCNTIAINVPNTHFKKRNVLFGPARDRQQALVGFRAPQLNVYRASLMQVLTVGE